MKRHFYLPLLLALACTGCRTAHPSADELLRGAEQLDLDVIPEEQAEMHSRFRPLERPMVRYHIEDAIREGDSCWTLVRITVPKGAIRKGERYTAQVVLHTPDGFMELGVVRLDHEGSGLFPTRPHTRKPIHFFLSNKFLYDPRMERNADISIFPEIESPHYSYRYMPIMLLLGWGRDENRWKRTAGLGEQEFLQTLPSRPQP